jgi:hypothetical protein
MASTVSYAPDYNSLSDELIKVDIQTEEIIDKDERMDFVENIIGSSLQYKNMEVDYTKRKDFLVCYALEDDILGHIKEKVKSYMNFHPEKVEYIELNGHVSIKFKKESRIKSISFSPFKYEKKSKPVIIHRSPKNISDKKVKLMSEDLDSVDLDRIAYILGLSFEFVQKRFDYFLYELDNGDNVFSYIRKKFYKYWEDHPNTIKGLEFNTSPEAIIDFSDDKRFVFQPYFN